MIIIVVCVAILLLSQFKFYRSRSLTLSHATAQPKKMAAAPRRSRSRSGERKSIRNASPADRKHPHADAKRRPRSRSRSPSCRRHADYGIVTKYIDGCHIHGSYCKHCGAYISKFLGDSHKGWSLTVDLALISEIKAQLTPPTRAPIVVNAAIATTLSLGHSVCIDDEK